MWRRTEPTIDYDYDYVYEELGIEITNVLKTERSYLDAAFRYFDAFKLAGDSSLKGVLVQKAITNYQEVIKLNPENLDAKTDLS